MATRSGDVPADLLFYLLRRKLFDAKTLETMLSERSGMLGLSGISEDMRDLQASTDPRATAAIAFFVYAMTKMVGAYASVLGGLDALDIHRRHRRQIPAPCGPGCAAPSAGSAWR